MTYLFKLAQRTARHRVLALLAVTAVLSACDTDRLTNTTEDSPTEDSPAPLFATGFRGGIPFGTFNHPTEMLGSVYNGGVRVIAPSELLTELAAIKARGGRVLLGMAGNERYYKDRNGNFSLALWKDRIDRFRGVNFSSYIDDRTVIGHYMIDEPNDAYNWGSPISGTTLEAMAAYSKSIWPKLTTVVRVDPTYLTQWGGYQSLDAAWAQWVTRKGDAGDYLRVQVAAAQKLGLGLVTGLNIRKGGPDLSPLSASVVQSAGSELLANDYPCAFISWEYDEQYLSRTDIRSAMANLSQKAEAHSARSCSTGAVTLPSISGIALKAAREVVSGTQIARLTWSGASSANVDLYINGSYRRTTANDGRARVTLRRAGVYTFKICEAGTTRCSNSASVTAY